MMNQNNLILKQGYKAIIITLLLALFTGIFISDFISCLLYIVLIILLFIYRNSKTEVNYNDNNIYSPISGKVIAIDNNKIYIKKNLCDNLKLTAPIKSQYKLISVKNGLNLDSLSYRANYLNTQAEIEFNDIKIKIIAGLCNGNLNLNPSSKLSQGEEFGILIDGLVVIEYNCESNIKIKLNEQVKANKTILFNNIIKA